MGCSRSTHPPSFLSPPDPHHGARRTQRTPAVHRWTNLAAPDDIVAARPDLLPAFDRNRPNHARFDRTWTVDNGSQPHQASFYLTKRSCGQATADALNEP